MYGTEKREQFRIVKKGLIAVWTTGGHPNNSGIRVQQDYPFNRRTS
jgi:hypothetical protein